MGVIKASPVVLIVGCRARFVIISKQNQKKKLFVFLVKFSSIVSITAGKEKAKEAIFKIVSQTRKEKQQKNKERQRQ